MIVPDVPRLFDGVIHLAAAYIPGPKGVGSRTDGKFVMARPVGLGVDHLPPGLDGVDGDAHGSGQGDSRGGSDGADEFDLAPGANGVFLESRHIDHLPHGPVLPHDAHFDPFQSGFRLVGRGHRHGHQIAGGRIPVNPVHVGPAIVFYRTDLDNFGSRCVIGVVVNVRFPASARLVVGGSALGPKAVIGEHLKGFQFFASQGRGHLFGLAHENGLGNAAENLQGPENSDRKQNSGHDQLRHRDAFVVADGIIHFHPRAWFLESREKSPVVPLSIHHEIPGHRVFPLIAMRRNGQTRSFPLLKAFF